MPKPVLRRLHLSNMTQVEVTLRGIPIDLGQPDIDDDRGYPEQEVHRIVRDRLEKSGICQALRVDDVVVDICFVDEVGSSTLVSRLRLSAPKWVEENPRPTKKKPLRLRLVRKAA